MQEEVRRGARVHVDGRRVAQDETRTVSVAVHLHPEGRLAFGITIREGAPRAGAVDDLDLLALDERTPRHLDGEEVLVDDGR